MDLFADGMQSVVLRVMLTRQFGLGPQILLRGLHVQSGTAHDGVLWHESLGDKLLQRRLFVFVDLETLLVALCMRDHANLRLHLLNSLVTKGNLFLLHVRLLFKRIDLLEQ